MMKQAASRNERNHRHRFLMAATQDNRTPAERLSQWMEASKEGGGLLPQSVLRVVLGVSKSRVSELIDEGRFECRILLGQRFVTCESIAAFILNKRKVGRPAKHPSALALAKASILTSSRAVARN